MGAALKLSDLPDWPAALTLEQAVAFTGMGEAVIKEWVKQKKVVFLPRGKGGALVARRADLQTALDSMFTNSIGQDFDFG